MHKLQLLFILISGFAVNSVFAQKNIKEDAAYYFDIKDYKNAYDAYDKLYAKEPKNLDYKFRLGVCALNYPDKKSRAIEIFEELKMVDKSDDINYYLGKAYHINYRFDEAIESYKLYIEAKAKETKLKDEEQVFVENAKLGIANSTNGKELITKKIVADIKNMGSPLNTSEDEYVPVITADESMLLYTYVGKNTTGGKVKDDPKQSDDEAYYHEDIYISRKQNDSTYSAGVGLGNSINTKEHNAAIALSPDGHILFTYSSTDKDKGDIYMSTLNGETWSKPERLNSNINTGEWEGSCSISSDGRFLYFASERPGGIGGRDLYISEKVNGDWALPINLGSTINTPYNEDAPFIHPDGITLFFSSEGHKSIGGYDIMYSIKQENAWLPPLSMGIPLNTTEDDRYYVINARGDRGYFSSNRSGSGGKGGQDIYMVEPGVIGEKPVLALLRGNVFANDKPTEAKIEINKKSTNEAIGPYYANSKSGKYLMALTPGNGYKIRVSVIVPGFEPIEEELDIEKLQKFVEIKKDFYVYSASYNSNKKEQPSVKSILDSLLGNIVSTETFKNDAPPINNVTDATTTTAKTETTSSTSTAGTKPPVLTPCDNGPLPDFKSLKGKSLNVPANYKQLLDIGGLVCAEGLVFKVQIAAYRKPDNYKYDHLKEFGNPEIISYQDGITRFTQLQFPTLKEAEEARKKIMAKGQKDAWVTAFINGKRYTLEELIMVDFLTKSIN